MKKIACLLLALMLCLVSAVAEEATTTPSMTEEDLYKVYVTAENLPADSNFSISFDGTADCSAEIEKLSDGVEAYFGDTAEIKQIVGADTLNVYELKALSVTGYDAAYGKVYAIMLFATPYEAGENVAVMIGIKDGASVNWTAFAGVGVKASEVENAGAIQVELDAETVAAMQENGALVAIVSK